MDREQIKKAMEAFIDKGGQIKKLPPQHNLNRALLNPSYGFIGNGRWHNGGVRNGNDGYFTFANIRGEPNPIED